MTLSAKFFAREASSLAALAVLCFAQQPAERTIPARTLPVPTTVSPDLQKIIAPAWGGSQTPMNLTSDEWKALQKRRDEGAAKALHRGYRRTADASRGKFEHRIKILETA